MVTQVVHHTQRFIFRKASKHKFVLMSVWSGNLEEIDSNVHQMSVFDQVMLHRSNNHKAWPLWPDSNRHKSTTLSVNCGRDRFAAGDHFRKLNTIYASHVTVFPGNAVLLLNTPLTNFYLMDACLQISYYQTTKLLQHFLLSLCSYTLSLGYREMSRTQSVHLQWDERDLYSYHNVNPLLNVGVITFCSLSPSWHDNVYRVFTNASVLQGFPDKEHAISFTFGRRRYCTPGRMTEKMWSRW